MFRFGFQFIMFIAVFIIVLVNKIENSSFGLNLFMMKSS